eukprot:354906-Chlamydomonas_euryale.AAC.6
MRRGRRLGQCRRCLKHPCWAGPVLGWTAERRNRRSPAHVDAAAAAAAVEAATAQWRSAIGSAAAAAASTVSEPPCRRGRAARRRLRQHPCGPTRAQPRWAASRA